MSLRLLLALVFASSFAACGHVPLSSMPSLMRIDFRTTNLADLRAAILLPEEIRPLPGGARLTIKVAGGGSSHERHAVLQEVTDAAELASLPKPTPTGMRMIAYRLPPTDAARLSAFREEILSEAGVSGRRSLTIGVGVNRLCNSAPLRDGPALMTSYLRTSETREYVATTRNLDLKKVAAEANLDADKMLTPCRL